MAAKEDQRRAARARHDSVLEIYDLGGTFITGVGRLVNFSTVGACFSTTKILAKSEPLHLRLRLLKEGVLEISARVIWTRKKPNTTLYGVEFTTVRNQPRP